MNKLVKKLKEMGYYKVWEGYGIKQYRKIQKYKNSYLFSYKSAL